VGGLPPTRLVDFQAAGKAMPGQHQAAMAVHPQIAQNLTAEGVAVA
jgi:hypothetical protein